MPVTKRGWTIVNGPLEFDQKSIYTSVEFTVQETGNGEEREVTVFVDTADPRESSRSVWGFRGWFYDDAGQKVTIVGIYSPGQQEGNFGQQEG